MTPLIFGHVIMALFFSTIMRLNRVSAVAGVFVTNPVTGVPLYFAAYTIGALSLGRPMVGYADMKQDFSEAGSVEELFKLLFGQMGMPLLVGCLILGAVMAVLTYFAAYRALAAYRIAKAKKSGKRDHEWKRSPDGEWRRVCLDSNPDCRES